jgi:hypothetical protein
MVRILAPEAANTARTRERTPVLSFSMAWKVMICSAFMSLKGCTASLYL